MFNFLFGSKPENVCEDTPEERTINNINKELEKYLGINGAIQFKTQLGLNRAVISGSFIVQCALGEYWDDSDIDIYISETYMTEDYMEKWFENIGAKCTSNNDYNRKIHSDYYRKTKVDIVKISDYTVSYTYGGTSLKKTFQLIYVRCPVQLHLWDYVTKSHDMRFCKNYYVSLYGIDVVKFNNFGDIKRKMITCDTVAPGTKARAIKYIKRGFCPDATALGLING